MTILVMDSGTSGLKAALVDDAGTIIARADADYGETRAERTHRQDPEAWWQAAISAVRQLQPGDIDAISLCGTMENLIPLGADGRPAGDAILYSDPIGNAAFSRLKDDLEGAEAILGNAPEPLMTAFKLHALSMKFDGNYTSCTLALPGSKDFLAFRLTGIAATDPTNGTTTGLMDIRTRDWSEPLLERFGIARAMLPKLVPASAVIGRVTEEAAAALGVKAGTMVVNGAGDGGATTLGSGALGPGDVSLYLGTTGWVARVAGPETLDAPSGFYRLAHPAGPGIIEIAPILAAGAAAHWARRALGLDQAEAEALGRAADENPGETLFLPYLEGERSPFLDLDLRGAFLNLDGRAGPGELYRAVLEGVAMAIAENLEAMGGPEGSPAGGRVTLAGGGALSPLWRQILADVTGCELWMSPDPVAAPMLGAWRLARMALGQSVGEASLSRMARPRAERAPRAAHRRAAFRRATEMARVFAAG
ncbi:hypothetical protein EMQ25_12270 [Arsenicitalea aurantiaca]|uniref:Xylulokinase n=1 Tax=Arsenicitalea aurantiaca TaxID=1783274 RepID=A0A433X7T1_9HYPH|nr:FGGY family carbohydrate kinase [Arsenicitalea aurantiaca]RUT30098.1 hypothetical protein EMQ25_12270 [Arsenicitalea aurantiaca]